MALVPFLVGQGWEGAEPGGGFWIPSAPGLCPQGSSAKSLLPTPSMRMLPTFSHRFTLLGFSHGGLEGFCF